MNREEELRKHTELYWICNIVPNCPIVKLTGKWFEEDYYHSGGSYWKFEGTGNSLGTVTPNTHDLFVTYDEAFAKFKERVNWEVINFEEKIRINQERVRKLQEAYDNFQREKADVKQIDLSELTYEQRQAIKAAVEAMKRDPDSTPITVYYNINKSIRSDLSGKSITNEAYAKGLNKHIEFRTGDTYDQDFY